MDSFTHPRQRLDEHELLTAPDTVPHDSNANTARPHGPGTTGPSVLPPLASWPVLLLAGVTTLLLLVASGLYGYFGDELYFLAAGDNLTWGYADQQPLVPLLARAMDTILPHSPLGLRIPAALATGAGIVFSALITREFGGNARAQVLTAGAFTVCPLFLINGRLLATSTFDPFLWTIITWLLVRWARQHHQGSADDRLLLWVGVVATIAIQVKFLIISLCLAVVIAVLLVGPRQLLRRPMTWAAAGIAVITTIPTLIWQRDNGWPQLDMQNVIRSESVFTGKGLFPWAFVVAGIVGAALLCYGLLRLLWARDLRPYRFLGVAFLVVTVLFLATGARSYYLVGLYPVTWAAAAVDLQRYRPTPWIGWPVYAISAVVALSVLTPQPLSGMLPGKLYNSPSIDWRELTHDVTTARASLPAPQQSNSAVITSDYWSASAIHHFSPATPVYSGSRGFGYFGHPAENVRSIVHLGGTREELLTRFHKVTKLSTVDTRNGMHDGVPIWLATNPKAPWSQLWPSFQGMAMYQ